MPLYEWRCESCKRKQTVLRSIAECDSGPSNHCACGGSEYKKVYSVCQKPANDSSRDCFPIKLKCPDGVERIFDSASQQKEYMSHNGLSLLSDWEDPTRGGKQWFDKNENANEAPTKRAEQLYEDAKFVTQQEASELTS